MDFGLIDNCWKKYFWYFCISFGN